MAYRALFSRPDVQVLSPTLVTDSVRVTVQSLPSGIVLDYQVPLPAFNSDGGAALLTTLTDAIENLMQGGFATGGFGTQYVDDTTDLLVDAVVFIVSYTPPNGIGQPLTAQAVIPVDIITADPQFGSFLTGGSAVDRLQATYDLLVQMAGG